MDSTTHRRVRFTAGIAIMVAVLVGGSTAASAGGWAVSTLDATPAPVPGEPFEVGFTIRQHGVTPVEVEGAAIEVIDAAGTVSRFPAVYGVDGHYVATVTIAEAGTYTWRVIQGWFAPQDLGALTVGQPTAIAAPTDTAPVAAASATQAPAVVRVVETSHEYPAIARFGLPALALVFGGIAVADLAMRRRHRRHETVVA